MNKKYLLVLIMGFIASQTQAQELDKKFASNPFFSSFNTPYNVPPFDLIKNEHFKPAFQEPSIEPLLRKRGLDTQTK